MQTQTISTVQASPVVAHSKPESYTVLEYRNRGESNTHRKLFRGDDHSAKAHKFIMAHVGGIVPEKFSDKHPWVKNIKDWGLATLRQRADEESIKMFVRMSPIWDWHVEAVEYDAVIA